MSSSCQRERKEIDFSDDEESIQSAKTGNLRVTYRKSREELNEIEKQRTRRINEQILSIRGLLDVSNVPTRKDKYSVLCSAYDFIVKLKKTIEDFRLKFDGIRLPDMNSDYLNFDYEQIHNQKKTSKADYQISDFRDGCDHLLKFCRSPAALMTIDAKFISCNESFSAFTGFSSDELLMMSLFNLSSADNLKSLFKSVGTLIDQPGNNAHHIWNQFQFKYRECMCFTSLWIINDSHGTPAFIQMMLVSLEDSVSGVGQNQSQTGSHISNTSSSPIVNLPADTTSNEGKSERDSLYPTNSTQDDMWSHKQKCVALLRQKFAEQQVINPNGNMLPLMKIKQEYERLQQQQSLFQADGEIISMAPSTLPPSRTYSSSPWLHPSQTMQTVTLPPSTYQIQPKYTVKLNNITTTSNNNNNQQQQQQQQYHHQQSQYHHSQLKSPQQYSDNTMARFLHPVLLSTISHKLDTNPSLRLAGNSEKDFMEGNSISLHGNSLENKIPL